MAAVGMPHMTRQKVAGSVDLPVPVIEYDTLVTMLQRHSDLIAANARIASSGCNLRLQEAVPIPNVTLYAAFQHDESTSIAPRKPNSQVSAPVPAFNRNQGNITTAHAELVRARQNLTEANNTLMSQLAENYNRYATSRTISESYRTDSLPDQVRVYRGVYDRFLIDGESIDFAQVVVAQQTLTQVVTSYLQSLSDSWMATVDLAELLQVDDLMTMDGMAITHAAISGDASAQQLKAIQTAVDEPSAGFEANSISATETSEVAMLSREDEKTDDLDQAAESNDETDERPAPLRSRRPRARMIGKSEEESVQ